MTYPIRNAGFAMGCLYMTVLGFDNITYGFILQQCVTESILGALVGVSAIGEKNTFFLFWITHQNRYLGALSKREVIIGNALFL